MNQHNEHSFYGTVIEQCIKKDPKENRLYYEIVVKKNKKYINNDNAEKKTFKLFSPKNSTYINQKVVIQYTYEKNENIISSIAFDELPVNNIICISGKMKNKTVKSGPFLGINYVIDDFKHPIEKSRVVHNQNTPSPYKNIMKEEEFAYIFINKDKSMGKFEFVDNYFETSYPDFIIFNGQIFYKEKKYKDLENLLYHSISKKEFYHIIGKYDETKQKHLLEIISKHKGNLYGNLIALTKKTIPSLIEDHEHQTELADNKTLIIKDKNPVLFYHKNKRFIFVSVYITSIRQEKEGEKVSFILHNENKTTLNSIYIKDSDASLQIKKNNGNPNVVFAYYKKTLKKSFIDYNQDVPLYILNEKGYFLPHRQNIWNKVSHFVELRSLRSIVSLYDQFLTESKNQSNGFFTKKLMKEYNENKSKKDKDKKMNRINIFFN